MIGLPEILILIVIALLVFRGYKYLPQLGRSSGKALRVGSEKAKELTDKAGEKHGDKFDPSNMGRTAGKGMREARELRDSFKGTLDPPKEKAAQPTRPATTTGGGTADDDDSTRGA
jgi:TatA/E family protein of Tat protein translocase